VVSQVKALLSENIHKDFPTPGVNFIDISTLIMDKRLLQFVVMSLTEKIRYFQPDAILAVEARGFLIAPQIADKLDVPLIPIRKKGKLPQSSHVIKTSNEYSSQEFELPVKMHSYLREGERVVLVDDVIATGGTLGAISDYLIKIGNPVLAVAAITEIEGLTPDIDHRIPILTVV